MTKILKIFITFMLAMFIGIANIFAYEVGDIIEFGSYPYYEDGTEKAIEWQILEKYKDGTALVVSKYGIDSVKYNETETDVTWENSTIRKWLNNDFYNKAFRKENKNLIVESYLINKDTVDTDLFGDEFHTKGGNNTRDNMFLLSIDEANKYFSSDDARKLNPTPFAKSSNSKNGKLYTDPSYGSYCWWWLRSPGIMESTVALVTPVGDVMSIGDFVNSDSSGAIRVAFKINLKEFESNKRNNGIIEFGRWPIGIKGEEAQPIEWEILEKKNDGTAIVLSSKVIDMKPYNTKNKDITWAESSLRSWLNGEFYSKAFTAEEKDAIEATMLENNDSIGEITQEYVDHGKKWAFDYSSYLGRKWHTKGGADTIDKVWLLSLEDMKRYGRRFSTDASRIAKPMAYLTKNGQFCSSDLCKKNGTVGNVWWWLRSPGYYQRLAAGVQRDGFVAVGGEVVSIYNGCVRPALKINLKNLPKVESLKKTDTAMNKNYFNKENTQKVDILALRKGFHPDRTRVVFDISDACVWEETRFSDSFFLQIKGAVSKIDAKKIKIGHEIKKVDISSNKDGRTAIKIDKGSTGGYVQVQLLDNPYRIVIDVFKLKDGQTQDQQYEDYLAGKIDISNFEDLNKYNELLSEEDKQAEEEITEEDRESVQDIKPLKQTAGKRIIVIDPGHGGDFEGTYFASGAFMGYEDKIQYTYETVDGKEQKVPLTRIITNDDRTYTEYITYKVPKYEKMVWEKKITLDQAKAIKAYFDKKKNSPFKVILTRETDEQLGRTLGSDLAYRGEFALKNKAAAFISMHVNFMGDDHKQECSARGFEIMYRSIGGDSDNGRLDYLKGDTPQEREQDKTLMLKAKEQGRNLSNIVSGNLKKHFVEHQPPNIDKEMGRKWSIAVLRIARYPAILIESGYLCNKEDRELLQKPDTNNKIAEALYNSLKQYFGIK